MPIINSVTAGRGTKPPQLYETEVVPTSFPTIVEPPEEADGWSKVTVLAPDNLEAGNIRKGVTIAGVEGIYEQIPNLQKDKHVKPEAFPLDVQADAGYAGLENAVIETPDNLEAENIKNGVTIAGVEGTYSLGNIPEILSYRVPDKKSVLAWTLPRFELDIDEAIDFFYSKQIPTSAFQGARLSKIIFHGRLDSLDPDALSKISSNTEQLTVTPLEIEGLDTGTFHNAYTVVQDLFRRCAFRNLPVITVNNGYNDGFLEYCRFIEHELVIPEGIEYLFSRVLTDISFTDGKSGTIVFPSTLKRTDSWCGIVYKSSSAVLNKLVVKATTPPEVRAYASSYYGYESITVPKGTLEAYKAATNWSVYADVMQEAEE